MGDNLDLLADEEGIEARPAPVSILEKIFEHKSVSRPAAEAVERKKINMPRELYNLIGNRLPIAPSNGYTSEKARLGAKKPAQKWLWTTFTNPGRKDNLQLSHWVRESDRDKEYVFSGLGKPLHITTFTDEEYVRHLHDESWTLVDTRLLLDLCQRFDLRFVVVQDQFASTASAPVVRDVEALKARYYTVVNRLAASRNLPETSVERAFVYDSEHESLRKKQLDKLLNRTPGEVHEEEMLKLELKRISQQKKEGTRVNNFGDWRKKKQAGPPVSHKASHSRPTAAAAAATARSSLLSESLSAQASESSPRFSAASPPLPSEGATEMAPLPAVVALQGTHLRSAAVHFPLHVKGPLADQVERHLAQLGVASHPLPTEKISTLYQEIRENIVALLNVERLTDMRLEEARLLQEKGKPSKKRAGDEVTTKGKR